MVDTINSAVLIDYICVVSTEGNQRRADLSRKTSSRHPRTHLHVGRDRVRDDPRVSIRIHNPDSRDVGDVAFLDQR